MLRFYPNLLILWTFAVAVAWIFDPQALAQTSPDATASSQNAEWADAFQIDRADHAVLVQLDRAKAALADRQWGEAVDILCRLSDSADEKLLPITNQRFVSLHDYCQMQFASLPPEALTLYRSRIDPQAQKWYEAGIAQREDRLLRKVVDAAFASSFGDKALMALGTIALESGDYAAARWSWERIVPHPLPSGAASTWAGYPDTKLDLADVRARLVLVSILEGSRNRAQEELSQFVSLHPNARGRWGGQEVKYVDALESMLADAAHWPSLPWDSDWPTFAGNPQRNKIATPLVDVGTVAWRTSVPNPMGIFDASKIPADQVSAFLCFEPLLVGKSLFLNDAHTIQAFRLDQGGPAWGNNATIYQEPAATTTDGLSMDSLGVPRFSMTAFEGRLYARLGSLVTNESQAASGTTPPSCLICFDLKAEGRLLWKVQPESGWIFEGPPVVDGQGVYVAVRRGDLRPQMCVACLEPDSGRMRWRRSIGSAESTTRGGLREITHNLLTLVGGSLYCNTNMGAVAAMRTTDGRLLWLALYPREKYGAATRSSPHWQRGFNPCMYDRGRLLVAPSDSPRIFAFDSSTGQALWQTGTELADVATLLGTTDDWLIAGGRKLYWIGLNDADRGRVKRTWPDSAEGPGFGRGLLAGGQVLWPTRHTLYVFDAKTAQLQKGVELATHGVGGGNVLVAGGRLVLAGPSELTVMNTTANVSKPSNPKTDSPSP